jgi:transcriptional regulator with PAS, ATPase and Fis domain
VTNTRVNQFNLSYDMLVKILDNTFGNIYVTDAQGKVLFANENSAKAFGMNRDQIVGSMTQDLIRRGVISKSTSLEAIERKDVTIGALTTQTGVELINYSKPVLDENENIVIVMTFGQEKSIMEFVMEVVENEKRKTQIYKEALKRISGTSQDLIMASPKMRSLYSKILKAAQTDGTIILYGESGVGKDVIANFIHRNSNRCNEPFIPINCAAIPIDLMESEFFGYEKGAFTGAQKSKAGLFELADKGTMFLDEIGELPLSMQAKFLRVLETGVFTRIGGDKPIKTNVRIIAATNRNLKQMVSEKTFREDLFFRLDVLSFTIPPLRERPEEIPVFVDHFLEHFNKKYGQKVSIPGAQMERFKQYKWKGNIRELKNVIERLVLLSDENPSIADAFQLMHSDKPSDNYQKVKDNGSSIIDSYKEEEKKRILEVLLTVNGNKTKAAKLLGISRGKLYKLLKECSV